MSDSLPHPESRWRKPSFALSLGLTLVAIGFMAYLRLVLMPGRIVPIAYGVPLLLCIWFDDLRLLWGMAICFLSLTLSKILFFAGLESEHAHWLDYALLVLDLSIVAAVLNGLIVARRRMRNHIASLHRANEELAAREVEIGRQNEELQAQTEELERQSEELHVANQDLAAREETLHHLLDLSRSLRADLAREEVLQRVCETARALLTGDGAAAIAERRDNLACIASHAGLGPELRQRTFPYEKSFMALVLSRGQSGFLEDTAMRPDLALPLPSDKPPIRSVLAAPLRLRGRDAGTLEVYAHQQTIWSATDVALIESLAAQASTSLESVQLMAEIAQERLRLETILRTLPIGVSVLNAEGTDLRVNPAGMAMLRIGADENLMATDHWPYQAIRDGQLLSHQESLILRALRTGQEIDDEELDFVFRTGERISALASAAPVRDENGKILGAVSAFTNVTQMKLLQNELDLRRREAEESNLRKTRFLAAVSHDIRTPANAINLLAELLRRATHSPELAREIPQMAEELQTAATSLVNLVSDVLDVSRFDSGKVELQNTRFDLRDLLEEVCGQLEPVAIEKHLQLRIDCSPPSPLMLNADRVKLGRVLTNLVNNAVKFTEKGGAVISARRQGDGTAIIEVQDTGIGIAAEHVDQIFDEFYQISNPERDRGKGAGLGLSISKRLIDAMEGNLSVHSEPGAGSTFTVTLPASMVEPVPESPPGKNGDSPTAAAAATLGQPLQGMRLLLVEDHDATRRSTAQILIEEGAEVLQAADGVAALRLLYEGDPQLLLLDMMLPDLDGRDILRAINRNRPSALRAVLVLTGDLTQERTEEVLRLGADALIHKPIDIQRLLVTCRGIVQPVAQRP